MEHVHQHYSDTKIRQEQYKKMKSHANIPK